MTSVLTVSCATCNRRCVLPKRFGKYGPTLHPTKTRLIAFRRPPYKDSPNGTSQGNRPGTFDLLGFKHYWSRSRKANWMVKRKTAASRFTRAVRKAAQWCRANRHRPIAQQHAKLCQKLRGHFGYYGITGNIFALNRFRSRGASCLAEVAPVAAGGRTDHLGTSLPDYECGVGYRMRWPSTRCVVSEAKVSLEQPYAVIL